MTYTTGRFRLQAADSSDSRGQKAAPQPIIEHRTCRTLEPVFSYTPIKSTHWNIYVTFVVPDSVCWQEVLKVDGSGYPSCANQIDQTGYIRHFRGARFGVPKGSLILRVQCTPYSIRIYTSLSWRANSVFQRVL